MHTLTTSCASSEEPPPKTRRPIEAVRDGGFSSPPVYFGLGKAFESDVVSEAIMRRTEESKVSPGRRRRYSSSPCVRMCAKFQCRYPADHVVSSAEYQ